MKVLDEHYPLYAVPEITTFADILRRGVKFHSGRPALADLRDTPIPRVTHGELWREVVRFGRALRRAGLAERDHVAVLSENRVQWAVAYLAVTTFNMVAVPIDRNLDENEVVSILHASDARGVVFSESHRQTVAGAMAAVRGLRVAVDMDAMEADGRVLSMVHMMARERVPELGDPFPAVQPGEVAVIPFTSGAIGRAKGVMLSQGNITANLMGMLRMVELVPEDRFLSVLPVHHTYECTCGLLCPLLAGASVTFARSLKTVVEDLQRVRATVLLGVPLLYEKMYRRVMAGIRERRLVRMLFRPMTGLAGAGEALGLARLRRRLFGAIHRRLGGAIRLFVVGGAPPDPEVMRGLRALGFTVLQGYGLTETSPILTLNRVRRFRDDAAGLPLPGVELRIDNADEEGRGEIMARGPAVMLGYYRNPEATAAVVRDGWFATGDLGYFDRDGFLHVVGRKKNVIVAANGKNVFPEELEDRVNTIPFVLEAMVHGIRRPGGGEEIAVMVVPNAEVFVEWARKHRRELNGEVIEEVLRQEVRALNRALPLYKQIRHVRVRENEFAKTTTQKIKRYLVHQDADATGSLTDRDA